MLNVVSIEQMLMVYISLGYHTYMYTLKHYNVIHDERKCIGKLKVGVLHILTLLENIIKPK